jgi:hypothetical protein
LLYDRRIRIREAKKHVDPVDPEHWFRELSFMLSHPSLQIPRRVFTHVSDPLAYMHWGNRYNTGRRFASQQHVHHLSQCDTLLLEKGKDDQICP